MNKLNAENLTLSINGASIVNDISFELVAGTMLGLVGPNGAGKSTLLKLLANLTTPSHGRCLVDDVPVSQLPRRQLAHTIGYLSQEATVNWPLKVRRVVELGRLPYQIGSRKMAQDDQAAIDAAIAKTEISHLLDRVVTTLSGGERMRVLLARLFATNPRIILADEPVASLDPYHQLHVMEILREHASHGGIVVTVLHDLNHAARFCDQLLLIDAGKMIAIGEPCNVLSVENVEKVYSVTIRCDAMPNTFTIIPHERIPHSY